MRKDVKDKLTESLQDPLNPIQDQKQNVQGDWLNYVAQPNVQGQCLLTKIIPVRKSKLRLTFFIFCCLISLGFVYLLVFWFPKLKKKFYYIQVPLQEATQFYIINNDGEPTYPYKQEGEHCFRQGTSRNVTFFMNRYLKYLVENGTVKAACLDFVPRLTQVLMQGSQGLSLQQARLLRKSYGRGSMILQRKSVEDLFIDQIMRPLYIFIVFSCLLWTYQQYFWYGMMIAVTAAFGIGTNLIQTYRLNNKIYNMAYYETQVNILRSGQIKKGSSKFVVPGDIVFVKDQMKMPFDGILLHGSLLANQCSITGQSVPIVKKAEKIDQMVDFKNSYIYEGSIIIQVNFKQKFKQSLQSFQKFRLEYGIPVYVVRTNFVTIKGQLIRIISFPVQKQNIFQKQSVKFLLFLFLISVISYSLLIIKLAAQADPIDLFVKFLDLVTVTVPPGLPVSMTFGIIFALEKLKKKSIFCTSPNKVILGGMTNFMCFDKTGTLTEDFMDFYCLLPNLTGGQEYEKHQPYFSKSIHKKSEFNINNIIKENPHIIFALNNMATNHTIVRIEETGENVGDPMEVKMFQFGQFSMSNNAIEDPSILEEFHSTRGHNGQVFRRFQFDSQLFRMSTIAKSTVTGEDFFIYTKGSPQQMLNIFQQSTIPKNFHKILKTYTCQGFRVLAIGHRLVKGGEIKLTRLELQKNLKFDGFQIFQNRLKPQTIGALQEFQDANIPCVMITGDNALTASSISFQCNIFDSDKKAFVCHCEGDYFLLEKFHQHQLQNFQEDQAKKCNSIGEIIQFVQRYNIQLCVTGMCFNHIFDKHFEVNRYQCEKLLQNIKVYARAKPNDKARIISMYQSLNKTVSMCGDGANDCGALKQADIGLSLSQAEASISAPFTSQVANISSMVELLKQCRAGLATNFSLFNIMAMYSLIQYNTVVMVQFYYGFPGDFHYLYWDVCCNFVFFLTFGFTGTAGKLTKQAPNNSLFTVSNLTQLLLAFFIQLAGQLLMIYGLNVYGDEIDYTPDTTYNQFIQQGEQFITDSYQGNILFMFSNFVYIFTLLAFSISRPWRKQFYTNIPFTLLLVLVLVLSTVLVIVPESRPQFMQLSRFNHQPLHMYILILGWGISILIVVIQKFLLEPFFNRLKLRNPRSTII